MALDKFQVSRDSQALYITIVTKDRLPVFQTEKIKTIACRAIDEARTSGEFLLFAYVIMPDHMHLLTNCPNTSADVLRYVKGITGRRVIDYLKEKKYERSLAKLRMRNGSESMTIHFGSKRRMYFLFSARPSLCRK
jgi:REP element-mobilizing transposase RayT